MRYELRYRGWRGTGSGARPHAAENRLVANQVDTYLGLGGGVSEVLLVNTDI
jgi:hypothetical protein